MSDKVAFWLIVALVAGVTLLPLLRILRHASKAQSPLGIHLSRATCPNCGAVMPLIRWPANRRQALWGGGTCRNCGTEMDKYGNRLRG